MAKPLPTAGAVIDALGGNSSVCVLTKSSPSRVANWRIFGTFPPNTYVALQDELEKRGYSAPAHLWKMREAENASAAANSIRHAAERIE